MASTLIVGDGPAGLSAALFLAKNDHEVTVYGTNQTAMHYAYLHNYLGVPNTDGTAFQETALEQVAALGATFEEVEVTAVAATDAGFSVSTESQDDATTADYLIIAGGKPSTALAESLGVETSDDGVATDRDGRSNVDKVYVVGRVAKPNRSQAIISAGIGAAAALDILSREAGENIVDWDSPPKD